MRRRWGTEGQQLKAEAVSGQQTLGPWWAVASAAAAAVGIAVGRPLAELVREPFSPLGGGLPTVAVFGAIFGLLVGLGHALAQRRLVPAVWWTLASTIGGAVGFVLGVKSATLITDPLSGQVVVYVSEVLGYLAFGAVVGVLLGLTQGGCTWRARGGRSLPSRVAGWTWVRVSAVGWALGFTVTASIGLVTDLPTLAVRDMLFGGLAGLIAGGTQALVAGWRTGR
jgi:hypothetical protein